MRLSKDRTQLTYNRFLTLDGIPPAAFNYRLGNRSALEWVINQYRVKTDKRSGITNDPNRPDDPQYILRLLAQVISVSLETVDIVGRLPELGIGEKETSEKDRLSQGNRILTCVSISSEFLPNIRHLSLKPLRLLDSVT